ncbi:adenosine deaminase 2 isoform X1 [Diachasma alloeum]|uniref:adenosine deaminase 2 isoform X1 n=2 Tax=Diachasma alloeum TaxID=454923 RepID=UPI0007381690|nr:adenosine deaminase 2 isoform X1 [Diachasma alloeum]
MMERIIVLSILSAVLVSSVPTTTPNYWALRNNILHEEEVKSIGGNLPLEGKERIANTRLMLHKKEEIAKAFLNPDVFLPARNFLEAFGDIEKSRVFEIIKKLPKGAVLHVHHKAMVHADWIYNATFRENLYVCDRNGELSFQFFQNPSRDCNWKLLSHLRNNSALAQSTNDRIRKELTMIVEDPEEVYSHIDVAWMRFEEIFDFITPIIGYRPVAEDHFYQGLKELYDDNVLYLEVKSGVPKLYDLDGRKYSDIEVVGIFEKVTQRFKNDYPDFIGAKIIYTKGRMLSDAKVHSFMDKVVELKRAYPDFIAGFDLAGQEDKGKPLRSFADRLNELKKEINFFFHAGETNWYGTSTDENLIDAVLLNTKRIGHGYAIMKHQRVLDYVKKNKIAIEVCPISNQVLGLVKDLRNHPASLLFAEGVPVVISNDDPGLWGSRALSYDFYEAFMGIMSGNADIRALKQLAMNSIIYSCLSQNEQARALDIWRTKWTSFINELSSGII